MTDLTTVVARLREKVSAARRNPTVLRDGRPVVTIDCDEATALLAVAEAADVPYHTECLMYDTPHGSLDTCDNLGIKPADFHRCPNCRVRDALAALTGDE